MMVRTQIQFDGAQIETLRQLSAQQNKSVSELVRDGVDLLLRAQSDEARIQRALSMAGKFNSGLSDISVNHDHYLAEAFGDHGE